MCTKKSYDYKWQAKATLKAILKRADKQPWRDEISIYKCEKCNKYHISSIVSEYTPEKVKEVGYFEFQKEKWGNWLQNFSQNGAVINKRNKRYST